MPHNTKINAIFVDIKASHYSVLVHDRGFDIPLLGNTHL